MSDNPFKVQKRAASVLNVREAEKAQGPSSNFTEERLIGMTFNMPEEWHREFKVAAIAEGVNMHELFRRCFEAWKRENRSGR